MKAAALLPVLLAAQGWSQSPVVLRSETRNVLVDVVVTDKKGSYVSDLTVKDFQVWEDKKEQTVQSVTLQSAAQQNDSTDYLVLVFDYTAIDAGSQIMARQSASRFIDANAAPNRKLAIANFDGSLQIAQGFTDNAGRLKDAVSGAKSGMLTAAGGATADISSKNRFLALQGLANSLAAVPGRKSIILFTGDLSAPNEQKSALTSAIIACNRANVAVYPIDAEDAAVPAATTDISTAGRGRGGFSPGNVGRGGRGASPMEAAETSSDGQQFLYSLANGTGGFVIRNSSELPSGLQKIGKEQEAYYLVSYTPPESPEGSCHALKVKLDRSGLTLRARSSYCTGKAQELISSNATDKDLEKRAVSESAGSISASMRLPFFYTDSGAVRVDLAMEFPTDGVKFEHRKSALHADVNILGIASTEDGGTAARFNDTLTLDLDEASPDRKKPAHYEKQFKIAPGQYKFAVVFSSGGESFGKIEGPLVIEPHETGRLGLSGLALSSKIRETSPDDDAPLGVALFDDRSPLSVNGVELIPSGSRAFEESGKLYAYFEVYGSGTTVLQARVLAANGGVAVWDGSPAKLDFPAGKASRAVALTVPVESMPPGSYVLEVSTEDAAGMKVTRRAAFDLR